ncbi:MAG: NF038132 family protein [Acidobacteria bacterium]|nr:NF038132 family protein [Acidobacteriota bacterium]
MQLFTAAVLLAVPYASAVAGTFSAGIPGGWTCNGTCGTLGADGVVTLAPGSSSPYGYVTTTGGNFGTGLGYSGDTNGSVLRTALFTANIGDKLEFYFNYITHDGSGFADYGWSLLRDDAGVVTDYLFTARTKPSGDIVPGFGLPSASATFTPATTAIIGGGPGWTPLGPFPRCYAAGCGYTGWIKSTFVFSKAGKYSLDFGVVNWSDTAYQSGLAFDGAVLNGVAIGGVPEPATFALMGAALGVIALIRRK